MQKPQCHVRQMFGGTFRCDIEGTLVGCRSRWMEFHHVSEFGKTRGEAINKAAAKWEKVRKE